MDYRAQYTPGHLYGLYSPILPPAKTQIQIRPNEPQLSLIWSLFGAGGVYGWGSLLGSMNGASSGLL